MTESLIDRYVSYTMDSVESDPRYHWWGAVGLISAVCGRGIYTMIRPGADKRDRLHLNLFMLFVGEPGAGKSTIHSEIREFADKVGVLRPPDSITAERLITWASKKPAGIFSAMPRELSSLINSRATTDFKTFLCNVYDCVKDHGHGTQARHDEIVIDACATIISTCTPAYLAECFRPLDWGQGFASRFLFIWGDPQQETFLPGRDKGLEHGILSDLHELASLSIRGLRILWTPEADAARSAWRREQLHIPPSHQHIAGYWNRRWVSAAKVAAIVALSRGSGIIDIADWELAVHKVLESEMNFPFVLGQSGINTFFPTRERVIKYIVAAGRPIKESELRNKIAMDIPPQYVDAFLEDILQSGAIWLDNTTGTNRVFVAKKAELLHMSQLPTTTQKSVTM